jgi:hypothetical protein
MTQRRAHTIDLTNQRDQIRLTGPATPITTPTHPNRALTDAELTEVAGGTDGPPTGAGTDSGKATPILF